MGERLTGAQLIADLLDNYGVTHVFFVSAILNHTMYQMELRTGITRVVTHGEKAAAYMADGYARASGRPGICLAQTVGAANLAAGLRDGYMGSSPIVALTGGPFRSSRGRHQYQEIDDDKAMFGPVTKSSTRVDSLDRIADTIRQAFRVATTGRPGPVHIEFENHHGDALELLEGDLDSTAEARFTRLPPFRPAPDLEEVDPGRRLPRPGEPPGDRGRRRSAPVGRPRRTGRPGRGAVDPGGHLAERQGRRSRPLTPRPSARSGCTPGRRPTGWWPRPISSSSSAPGRGAW